MAIALIVAAGLGERLGADCPKAFVELGGRPMLLWSTDALLQMDEIELIVLALPPGSLTPDELAGERRVLAVAGGASRSESVRRALAAAPGVDRPRRGEDAPDAAPDAAGRELVLVHDAARPLLTSSLARNVLRALEADEQAGGAIAAAPVSDTIKRVDEQGVVLETIPRSGLWAVQTPQVFRRDALERALDVSGELLAAATDDAWLVERAGGRVRVVDAGCENLKVTTPRDLERAAALLARGPGRAQPA